MKVLITGAFGYLGGRIAAALEHELVLGARRTPDWAARRFSDHEMRELDVLDPAMVERSVRGIDAVIHLASLDEIEAARDPDLAVRVSGEGTRRMLAASYEAGVRRFIYLSTIHAYGPDARSPITEDLPLRPVHPYALSRLVGEGYCFQSNREHGDVTQSIVVRLSNGYGAPIDPTVDRFSLAHNDFCKQAVTTGRIVLKSAGLQHRDIVWTEDVAQGMELLLTARSLDFDIFNLGGGRSLSMLELAERVRTVASERLGRPIVIERPPPRDGERGEPVVFSIQRMQSIGYVPRDGLDVETVRLIELLQRSPSQ
jgi:UDP-glucose 4-epimerase